MGILTAVAPVAIVGGISVFVVYRLKHKYKQGTLGKKKNKRVQHLLDSLIPIGMLLGCMISTISSIFLSLSLLSTLSLGAGFGLLFGYFSYEIYSKKEENFS